MGDFLLDVDVWIEAISFVVALLVSLMSLRAYLLTEEKRHAFLGAAFGLIAGGVALSAVFNSVVQFETLQIALRGYLGLSVALELARLFSIGLLLTGYMTIFVINERIENPRVIVLLYLLTLFAVVVSHEFYVVYHAVSFVLLLLILHHTHTNYLANKSTPSLLVLLAFGTLALSQALFLFVLTDPLFYIAGNIGRLVSFLFFLAALAVVFRRRR